MIFEEIKKVGTVDFNFTVGVKTTEINSNNQTMLLTILLTLRYIGKLFYLSNIALASNYILAQT